MTDKTMRGRFVWHELATSDAAAANTFYSKALGWKVQSQDNDASYSMFAGPSGPVGGSTAQTEGAPNWLPYIGTTDLEKTIGNVTSRGGAVKKSITDIPGMGRYAILTDPQGAAFGVYATDAPPSRDAPAKRGEYSWHELATTDAAAAVEFYSALFGWQQSAEHDMGPMGKYHLIGRNGRDIVGIFNKMADQPGGPAWLGYVRVKDLDRTVKKVKSAGGTLINGPMEVPGGDWIAQFMDSQGVMFAAHQLLADRQPAAAPAAQETSAPIAAEEPAEPAPAAKPAAKAAPKKPAAKKAPAKKAAAKKAPAKKSAGKKVAKKKSAPRAAAKAKAPARKAAKAAKKKATKKAAKPARKKSAKRPAKKAKQTARKAK